MIEVLRAGQIDENVKNEYAVRIRNAYKYYGSKKTPLVVLQDLNMTIPKGVIYGLLGASGCGKTTLLNCIVGHKHLDSGNIWVLGANDYNELSYQIGYMPQETALYGEFSIRETLMFFGWITGMTTSKIEERSDFLIKLFKLPQNGLFVKNLSGGQQRRVSLAVALLHEPELLILDEPTVGLDPILRESIWDHFLSITKERTTTVIITTHYIDEARQANVIALMRGGYFLAEDSPENLLNQYGFSTLEDVFSQLSIMQNEKTRHPMTKSENITEVPDTLGKSKDTHGISNETFVMEEISSDSTNTHRFSKSLSVLSFHGNTQSKVKKSYLVINRNHLKALSWKNFYWMMRNISLLISIITLPILQNAIFCLGVGHDPINLSIAAVNHETNNTRNCQDNITCSSMNLGCYYLKYLEKRNLKLIYYDSDEAAVESVLKGNMHASFIVKHNYSAALKVRLENAEETKSWDFDFSEIDVFRDVSNKHIAQYLKIQLFYTFKTFVEDYLNSCNAESRWLLQPIKWEKPVYGSKYLDFTDFAAPGVILTTTCFLGMTLTAAAMVTERKEGTFDRLLITGVDEMEMLISHGICQLIIMIIQLVISLITLFVVFGLTNLGSFVLVTFFAFLSGLLGMSCGLCISCAFTSEIPAIFTAMGSFLPILLLSGFAWPKEGMHHLLQSIATILPFTQPTESLRSVMHRGWDLSVGAVYMGFIVIIIWILCILILSIIILKFKKP